MRQWQPSTGRDYPGARLLKLPGSSHAKELDHRLEKAGHCFEWADTKQDFKALQETTVEDQGKTLVIHRKCLGTCGKVFRAVVMEIPPTI